MGLKGCRSQKSAALVMGAVLLLGLPFCEALPAAEREALEDSSFVPPPLSPKLLGLLPEEVRYRRVPLAPEKNAYALWVDAAKRAVELDDSEAIERALNEVDVTLPPETMRRLEVWIERNASALASLEAGLKRGGFQLPEEAIFGKWDSGSLAGTLLRAKVLRAKFDVRSGRYAKAARDLEDVERVAELVLRGDAGTLRSMMFMGPSVMGSGVVRFLASRKDVPEEVLEGLLERLGPRKPEAELVANAIRFDLCGYVLPLIAVGMKNDEERDHLLALLVSGTDFLKPETRALIRRLLEGHPRPFDGEGTIRLAGNVVREIIQAGQGPWNQRRVSLIREIEKSVEAFDRIAFSFFFPVGDPPSEEQVEAGRKALAKVENPVGRVVVAFHFGSHERLLAGFFSWRTQREATRAVLGLRLFAMRFGDLPASLDTLVEKKVLPAVPLDPFTGKPLHYSREKRLLWSVGPDGKEKGHGGAWDEEGEPRPHAWEVPPPNRGQGVKPR